MKIFRKYFFLLTFAVTLFRPTIAKADLWGGDVVVLTQILANAVQQLYHLKQILSTGHDTLGLMREINRGIRHGLGIIQIINPKFNPGLYGSLETAERVLNIISDLYGIIPQTSEYVLQKSQDLSASESIAMNSKLFRFADDVDKESERILKHAQGVNPQGAAKLTAESVAILIGVTSQVLRTNSMMLKVMGQNMALANRKEKLQSEQFKTQYEGLSESMSELPKELKLPTL
jgi:hypothetical protein